MRPKNYDTDENSMPKEYAKVEERMHSCLYYLSFIVVLNLYASQMVLLMMHSYAFS